MNGLPAIVPRSASRVRIAACADIPAREGRAVRIGDRSIAIFNLGSRFVAVDDRCPHRGGPLSDGIVAGSTIVCPLHAWKISLDSGGVEQPKQLRACIRTYPVIMEDGVVIVDWPPAWHETHGAACEESCP